MWEFRRMENPTSMDRPGHDLAEALAYLGNDVPVMNDLEEAADFILAAQPAPEA
jgi:hypothetical protein